MVLSKSASVWRVDNRLYVLDPENRVVVTQSDTGEPEVSPLGREGYRLVSETVMELGELV